MLPRVRGERDDSQELRGNFGQEVGMVSKEKDGVEALLFDIEGIELLDFKCCRGDREDVTEAEIRDQLHSAIMQKKMGRASVSQQAPQPRVTAVNVREFVQDIATPA